MHRLVRNWRAAGFGREICPAATGSFLGSGYSLCARANVSPAAGAGIGTNGSGAWEVGRWRAWEAPERLPLNVAAVSAQKLPDSEKTAKNEKSQGPEAALSAALTGLELDAVYIASAVRSGLPETERRGQSQWTAFCYQGGLAGEWLALNGSASTVALFSGELS